jgi:hypothetical protein
LRPIPVRYQLETVSSRSLLRASDYALEQGFSGLGSESVKNFARPNCGELAA